MTAIVSLSQTCRARRIPAVYVLLSALIRVDSKPYQVVQAWFDGRFELASSAAQSEEFSRVCRYPRVRQAIGPAEARWFVNRIRESAVMIEPLAKVDVSADPGDNLLLGMAQAVDADFLVTGDKTGLLALSRHLFDRGPGLAGGDVRGEAADAGILCEAEVLGEPEDAVLQVSRLDRRRALDGRCRSQYSRIARSQPHQDAMTG